MTREIPAANPAVDFKFRQNFQLVETRDILKVETREILIVDFRCRISAR